jgi:hypothetical protein
MNTNVNGGSNQGNNLRIDGAQDSYPWLPANNAYIPPADAIEFVNIVTNSFDAEQGMAGGMAAIVRIKSGTNQFHGTGHEFHTDGSLRAENWFQPQTVNIGGQSVPFRRPKDVQNQWGGTFGGPIKRNKLFFFTDFERTTERKLATRTLSVPTDAMRNGDFRAFGTNIFDPNTGNANGTGRSIISCNGVQNTICPNRFDPAALALIKLTPEPNLSGNVNNFFSSGTAEFNRNTMDTKIDYAPTQKASIFGRYSLSQTLIFDPPDLGAAGGDATNFGNTGNAPGRVQVAVIGGSYTLSPNMLVDANIGFTRQRLGAEDTDIGSNFGLDTLHIPGTNGPSRLQGGIPAFQFNTWSNLGNASTGSPFLFRDNQWVSNENFNWTRGRHQFRAGMEYNRTGINHFQPQGGAFQTARGSFRFTGNVTTLNGGRGPNQFNSFAQFLLGLPTETGTAIQNVDPNSLRFSQWAAYVRDQWQINSRLTVTYGLRWERYPFGSSDHGGLRFLDTSTQNVLIGGHGNVPKDDGVKIGPGQFLPRLGVAWRPLQRTVVRAGYGISADNNNWRFFRNAFPAVTISDFFGVNNFAPAAALTTGSSALTPYPGLPVGIQPISLPDISSGVIPFPNFVGTTTAAKNFRRGYTHSFNLTIGQEFAGFVVDAGYVGSRSIRPLANININPAAVGAGFGGRLLNQQFAPRAWGDINELIPFGNAYYDSLQIKAKRKLKGNSLIGISYTWSKAIDYTDNEELNFLVFPFPAYAPHARGLASFDRTSNLRAYGVYQLPFGRGQRWATSGWLSALAGGWQTNWILSRVSGVPLTITGANNAFLNTGLVATAVQTGPINIIGGTPVSPGGSNGTCATSNLACHYFDPSSFAPPSNNVFANTGRDILRGPGFFNVDMSLFRYFKLTERFALQVRGEAFGLTNTPHFNNPGTFVNAGNFGIITSSSGERSVWLAAKLIF